VKAAQSDLQLEEEEEEMVLRLGEHDILTSNAENIVQRMTLEALTKVLQKA